MTSNLRRRVGALEALTAEARLRPVRAAAARLGVPIEPLLARAEELRLKAEALRAAGLAER